MQVFIHKPGLPKLELLESRSLVVLGNGPVEFNLGTDVAPLVFSLEFENDDSKDVGAVRVELAPNMLSVQLICNKMDGRTTAFTEYWKAGAYRERELYVAMAHAPLGINPPGRLITMSFCLGGPAPATPPPHPASPQT